MIKWWNSLYWDDVKRDQTRISGTCQLKSFSTCCFWLSCRYYAAWCFHLYEDVNIVCLQMELKWHECKYLLIVEERLLLQCVHIWQDIWLSEKFPRRQEPWISMVLNPRFQTILKSRYLMRLLRTYLHVQLSSYVPLAYNDISPLAVIVSRMGVELWNWTYFSLFKSSFGCLRPPYIGIDRRQIYHLFFSSCGTVPEIMRACYRLLPSYFPPFFIYLFIFVIVFSFMFY